MRRLADRALSPQLRETYLRSARDWERMAEDIRAKEAAAAVPGRPLDAGAPADASGAVARQRHMDKIPDAPPAGRALLVAHRM
jgi:hypothetical protein